MKQVFEQEVAGFLESHGIQGPFEFSTPPNPEMGDIAFACFAVAKERGDNPATLAKELASRMDPAGFIARVEAAGPYLNIYLHTAEIANAVLAAILQQDDYGKHETGMGKKTLVEYACPNPLKAFHLGHLKNLITGEAVVRVLENTGHHVVRVNYQGDVGMHIAKALWGIYDDLETFEAMRSEDDLATRVEFLGKAYAKGAARFDESDEGKEEVIAYNDKVYEHDGSIEEVYRTARAWSLDYFDRMYKKMGSHFDRFYFESEMFERAIEIVEEHAGSTFVKSDGAMIFEGGKHGLHDRVFLNSKGFPTYEAKELALAEMHQKEHHPDRIIHVVGKEQTEYFKVVIKAIEAVVPELAGKEIHLPGGFLQLKGEQKMSSRTGNVVTGDALLASVERRIAEIMKDSDVENKVTVQQIVSVAALKYAMLKADVTKDVAFDLESSVSTQGDSGPYLLYIVARIKSILEKIELPTDIMWNADDLTISAEERALIMLLSVYPCVTMDASEKLDPSLIAKYLFELAQSFNAFYATSPVLQAEDELIKGFRISLLQAVAYVMQRGLHLLGIETVDAM